jgi:hypothetical protein
MLNPLLPVQVAAVEQRPLPELYSPRVTHERFDTTELRRISDEQGTNEVEPDLFSFRSQERQWQRAAYFNDYSFMFDYRWRETAQGPSSIKSNLKLSGTYDGDGEVAMRTEGKGIYIDFFS